MKLKNILIIILLISIFCLIYWQQINSPVDKIGNKVIFLVNKGESVNQITDSLVKNNLIKSKLLFKFYLKRQKGKIIAGEYILDSSMTTEKIVNILSTGQVLSNEKSIIIIEGWNIDEIGKYLKDNKIIIDDSFVNSAKTEMADWKFEFPKPEILSAVPKTATLEGYLFPDTYRIFNEAKSEDIIYKMISNFDKKLTVAMKDEIKKQKKSIHEIIAMASMIEEEVRTAEDMKIVSGIFWDRIKNSMPLQSDATLTYILGVKKDRHTYEETKIDSPYNTYKNLGLPPGPICNPGLAAITAAIYPTYTNYNYFLSKTDTGETVFSVSLDEHNMNKIKYLK